LLILRRITVIICLVHKKSYCHKNQTDFNRKYPIRPSPANEIDRILIFRASEWRKEERVLDPHKLTLETCEIFTKFGEIKLTYSLGYSGENPIAILPPSKAGKVLADAHQIADKRFATANQKRTGSLPKHADSITVARPPIPNMNTLPASEWLTSSTVIPQYLR
jgi:hypothetical protein